MGNTCEEKIHRRASPNTLLPYNKMVKFLVVMAGSLAPPSYKLEEFGGPSPALNTARMLDFASHLWAEYQPQQTMHKSHNACSGPGLEKCKVIMNYCFMSIKLAKT